ncbi:MAG: hypothetical protein ACI8SE_000344 [Bacteroidia bacterium]|jgi:hypothetical protein
MNCLLNVQDALLAALRCKRVAVSGGVLSATIGRIGGGFSFTTESFTFVASATSHTITFKGTVSGTGGLIVDDVAVEFVSALPVDLIHFDSKLDENGTVTHNWATAMERNNDYFTIEQSIYGSYWSEIEVVNEAGNSTTVLRYQTTNDNAIEDISYYRLKQTDFDGTFTYSVVNPVRANRKETQSIKAYPNPTTSQVTISNVGPTATIKIINSVGQDLTKLVLPETNTLSSEAVINLTLLPPGV